MKIGYNSIYVYKWLDTNSCQTLSKLLPITKLKDLNTIIRLKTDHGYTFKFFK